MEHAMPIRKLFILNLAGETTFKDFKICFSQYGMIDNCYIRRSKGKCFYGFVTFHNEEDAEKAMQYGKRKMIELHNRILTVMPADTFHQPNNGYQQLYYLNKRWGNPPKIILKYSFFDECSQNNIKKTSINTLNNDCLIHIFSNLGIVDRIRVERVCTRWKVVAQDSWYTTKILDYSIWHEIYLLRNSSIPLDGLNIFQKILLKCGKYLTKIALSDIYTRGLDTYILRVIGILCPNITNIKLLVSMIDAGGLNELTKNCRKINTLCLGSSKFKLDDNFKNLFIVLQNLKYLYLVQTKISGKCLLYLEKEKLHTLGLYNCFSLKENYLCMALKRLKNLKRLSITLRWNVREETMQVIGTCISLKVLILKFSGSLSEQFFTHLTNLQAIQIKNGGLSDSHLINLVLHCEQLTYIDIAGCKLITDIGLATISKLPKLETLVISRLTRITHHGLCKLHNLKVFICSKCVSILDENISPVVLHSPELEILDVTDCPNITPNILHIVKDACKNRLNNVVLKMFVKFTSVYANVIPPIRGEKLSPFVETVVLTPDNLIYYENQREWLIE